MPLVRKCAAGAAVILVVFAGLLAFARPADAVSPNLVLSQVYGGGGNSGATYTNDFIEVFNRGSLLVDLTFMSVQYGATTGNIGPNAAQITPLSGFLAPGQYLLHLGVRDNRTGQFGTSDLPLTIGEAAAH